jgi:hypothetical protein
VPTPEIMGLRPKEKPMTETNASGAQVPCILLLGGRDAAIEKVVKDCGGDYAPDNERLRVAFVMVAREAAGRGFDEGVRFIAANTVLSVKKGGGA